MRLQALFFVGLSLSFGACRSSRHTAVDVEESVVAESVVHSEAVASDTIAEATEVEITEPWIEVMINDTTKLVVSGRRMNVSHNRISVSREQTVSEREVALVADSSSRQRSDESVAIAGWHRWVGVAIVVAILALIIRRKML